jgi:hypothetical protein
VVAAASPSAPLGGTPTVVFFTCMSAVALNGGAQVSGLDTGSLDLPPGLGGFASPMTFGGGAGGQLRLRGNSMRQTAPRPARLPRDALHAAAGPHERRRITSGRVDQPSTRIE